MLYVFDADDTLVQKRTILLRPQVRRRVGEIKRAGHRTAIATNQGSVGQRHWMTTFRFGKPDNLPTAEDMIRLYAGVQHDLRIDNLYMAFAYRAKSGYWSPTPEGCHSDPFWRMDWRKPAPGMLLQAMRDASSHPSETVYVGDRPEDQAAAAAAGVYFFWAEDFFSPSFALPSA